MVKLPVAKNSCLHKLIFITLCLVLFCCSQAGYAGMKIESYKDAVDGKEYVRVTVDDVFVDERTIQYIVEVLTHYPNVGALSFERVIEFQSEALINILRALQIYLAGVPSGNNNFTLELHGSNIRKNEVRAIVEILHSDRSISSLKLDSNKIGKNIYAITEALKTNHTLTHLSLSDNDIGDEGALAIADFLMTANHTLTHLNVAFNNIGEVGIKAIVNALRFSKTLTSLNIGLNPNGDEAVPAIAELLRTNKTIIHFNMLLSDVSAKGLKVIFEALINNTTIQEIEVDWEIEQQKAVVKLVLERNRMLAQVIQKIRELLRNISLTMLSGIHTRAGRESPLSMLDRNVFGKIISYYHNELDFIMNATDAQFGGFSEIERNLLMRIRALQNDILVRTIPLIEEARPETNQSGDAAAATLVSVVEEPLFKRQRILEKEYAPMPINPSSTNY